MAPHHRLRHTLQIEAPIDNVFALLTPEGERSWVPGWDPQYVTEPDDPHAPATVFETNHGGESTTWMVVEIAVHEYRARYARINPGSRMALVDVRCHPDGAHTRVEVAYDITGLDEQGLEMAREFANGFAIAIDMWKPLMESVL